MQGYLKDRKLSLLLMVSCWCVYCLTAVEKAAFGSAMTAMIGEGLLTKSNTGFINALFYIFYGLGQLYGGYYVERHSPYRAILVGLVGSAAAGVLMYTAKGFAAMVVIWSLCGIVQFGVWPGIVKLLSTALCQQHRQKAMDYIFSGLCVGNLICYLASYFLFRIFPWRSVYLFSSMSVLIATAIWIYATLRVRNKLTDSEGEETRQRQPRHPLKLVWLRMYFSGVFLMLVTVLISNMLNFGVKSWVPTMIMESYHTTPGFSNLLNAIVLLFNLFGILALKKCQYRIKMSEASFSTILILASLPLLASLLFMEYLNIYLSVLILSFAVTFMYAVNVLLAINIPFRIASGGMGTAIAGILNAVASFGNVISMYGFGVVTQHGGWETTKLVWLGLAVIALSFTLLSMKRWNRFCGKLEIKRCIIPQPH